MTRLTHGTLLALGPYRVRCAPHVGMENSPTRTVFEILDANGRVVAKQLSCPSADDCQRALRAAEPPRPVAEGKPPKFNPEFRRTPARRARQIDEEGIES